MAQSQPVQVSLSSAALFHGLQEAESNDSASVFHFLWLLISVCLFIWEIHAMFSTTFGYMKEMKLRAYSKPPPSYNQVRVHPSSLFLIVFLPFPVDDWSRKNVVLWFMS